MAGWDRNYVCYENEPCTASRGWERVGLPLERTDRWEAQGSRELQYRVLGEGVGERGPALPGCRPGPRGIAEGKVGMSPSKQSPMACLSYCSGTG